jgi:uncharacterized membrane protein
MALAGLAFRSYRRPLVPLSPLQRSVLTSLRGLALIAVLLFACRPIILLPPANAGDIVVPVLVDTSRSMRIADADGESRIAAAQALVTSRILPALSRTGKPELFRVGEGLTGSSPESLVADGRRTDLAGAVAAARERFRGRRVAGIVVVSDGGDTGHGEQETGQRAGAPVFAIGVGSPQGVPDREVVGITAGDPRLDQALVELHVTTVEHGLGRDPYTLRLLANGQLIESRRVVPAAEGTPSDETFTVTPDPLNATVYTAEIVADAKESSSENNTRSILLSPAARKRRLLVLGGSPGYEHSFLVRALSHDPSFEIDSIVRKGKDDSGRDTFLIQAAGGRGASLTSGFPTTRESLFAYDTVIIGNLEGEFFGRTQMELLADFVSVRGGGLLLLGARTFLQRGIAGSPLEEALPVELNDRRGGAATRAGDGEGGAVHNLVILTPEGALHPIMRIAPTPEESKKQWAALPPLASSSPVGGPRPGATVLATTQSSNGAAVPLVAIQRYGRGRSMVFSGEASWRWRMLRPATDRSYEFFWRQAARWLSSDAPDPVTLNIPDAPAVGDSIPVQLEARNAAFVPVADASVEATLTAPGKEPVPLALRPSGGGQHAATVAAETPGLYRVRAEARQGATLLGVADRWFYVGGSDPEYADPRLNEGFLRRLARQSGGQYVPMAEADRALSALSSSAPQTLEPERRDLWHEPWAFAFVLLLLAAEWVVRRAWGMR